MNRQIIFTKSSCFYINYQCVAAGCCWSPVDPNPSNLPWCFYQNAGTPICNTNSSRQDCGYDGITQSRKYFYMAQRFNTQKKNEIN